MERLIKPIPPYNMRGVLAKLATNPLYVVDRDMGSVTFPVRLRTYPQEEKQALVICVLTDKGTIEEPLIQLQAIGRVLNAEEEEWLIQHVSSRFQWQSRVLNQFYEAYSGDSRLGKVIHQFKGVPLLLDEGIYECLIKTIVHQQLNIRFAQTLVASLAQDYGDYLEYDGQRYHVLPTPAQLADVDVAELRTKKFSQRKAEYITGVARRFSQGELNETAIEGLGNQEILDQLTKERGIGVWTVECILLFALGRPNLFPVGDMGIRNAIMRLEGMGQKPTPEECLAWIQPYKDWGSYVALYLWEYLGNARVDS